MCVSSSLNFIGGIEQLWLCEKHLQSIYTKHKTNLYGIGSNDEDCRAFSRSRLC